MELSEIRRANLAVVKAQHGTAAALAKVLNINPVQLAHIKSGWAGARVCKMGDTLARRFEQKLGLPEGWFDTPHGDVSSATPSTVPGGVHVVELSEIRRANLALVKAQHGTATALAKVLNTNQTQLTHIKNGWTGTQVCRMGDTLARRFEQKLDLPYGWFDTPHGDVLLSPVTTPPAAQSRRIEAGLLSDLDHVLDLARTVFLDRGVEGSTIEDLTQAMGMSQGGVYHEFCDKEGLFRSVVDAELAWLDDLARTATAKPTAREVVRHLLTGAVRYATKDERAGGFIMTQCAGATRISARPLCEELRHEQNAITAQLVSRFETAKIKGSATLPGAPEAVARLTCMVLEGMALQAASGIEFEDLKDAIDVFVDQF